MSYVNNLVENNTKAQLEELAKDYGIDVVRKNKTQLAEDIAKFELGVPAEIPVDFSAAPVESAPVDTSDHVLVRFTGSNSTFQVGDSVFSRKNPFLAVPPSVAAHVYKTWPSKFRPASHVEVEAFYA
jgi:hypothetical protein